MENLVYIHLASTYEETGASKPLAHPKLLAVSPQGNWKKFSRKACLSLLSITFGISCLGISTQAMASVLKQGTKGPEVAQLQQQLQQLGYFNGRATGNFGPLTKAAVVRFQQARGLKADGVAGQNTLDALYDRSATASASASNSASEQKESFPIVSTSRRPTLKIGARGSDVRTLQQLLANANLYNGNINGIFDPTTNTAVKEFQRSSGLLVDGVVGKKTWSALADGDTVTTQQPFDNSPFTNEPFVNQTAEKASAKPVLRVGDKGNDVTELQQSLKELGYFKTRVTGVFGSVTKAAVIRFQQDKGLMANGIVDSRTQTALQSPSSNSTFNVTELQKRLKAQGFYQGAVDGRYNDRTKAAVKAAQQAYGISEDDILRANF